MKPVAWMIAGGLGSWLAMAFVLDSRTWLEVLAGLLGPLVAAIGTWVLVARTYRRVPAALTGRMSAALVGKMVFFAGYVAVMLRGLGLRPVPFVTSFTGYLIVLYAVEALLMRRLFANRTR
jgi:hypothetical protein